MKIIWMSDIHLNFLGTDSRELFYRDLESTSPEDVIIISGDIAESHNVVEMIEEMEKATGLKVYFVCGNHDFYGSSIKKVHKFVKHLNYIPKVPYTPLNADTALLGVDGWGDCRYGDYENSCLMMSDWLYIAELRKGYGQGPKRLKETLQKLADKYAEELRDKVEYAIEDGMSKILIVTHVPPFEEVSLHAGTKGSPDGLPFFASKILGDTILPIAKKNPEVDFIWLSGHTHSRSIYKPCENMTVKVANAEYYYPQVEEVFDV